MAKTGKPDDGVKIVTRNRKASHEYHLSDRLECGIVLVGTEVKSLRDGHCSLDEAYAKVEGGELWLVGCEIPEYAMGNRLNHKPKRGSAATRSSRPVCISRMGGRKSRSRWLAASSCTTSGRR
jgi:SmpB protein